MNRQPLPFSKTVFLLAAVAGLVWASAGDLDPPPGEIRPTMKSLTEVEPRSALSPQDLPTTISAPGSYYLAGDYTETSGRTAIHITAGGVTLDLNGYTLYGNQVGTIAVTVTDGVSNTTIRNGHIRNWTQGGIYAEDAQGVHVEGIHIDTVGGAGFFLVAGSMVEGCSARRCGPGFEVAESTLTRCVARDNTTTGFMVGGGTITECVAAHNANRGFAFGSGTLARSCTARYNDTGFGLHVKSVLRDCIAVDNTGAGILATGSDNRIENNDVTGNGIGLDIDAAGNLVAGNVVKGNDDNYDFVSGNQLNILLCEIPETIDWPALVTIAGSLTGTSGAPGLLVNSDNVTIDLGGHALVGVSGSGTGIFVLVDIRNLAVRNGTLRDWGGSGLDANNATNGHYEGLRASDNASDGIRVGANSILSDCAVRSNGDDGISVGSGSIVTNCTAYTSADDGIMASYDSQITGCTARSNSGDGVQVSGRCQVTDNTINSSGSGDGDGAAVHAVGDDNRIESNHCIGGDRGLDIDGAGNYVADNTVKGAADNYDIAAGNQLNILLCEIPEAIDWPAQVTLAGSLTGTAGANGITVNSSDVSIDLGGHTLIGVPDSLGGIQVSDGNYNNISIRNGAARDWGFSGFYADPDTWGGSLADLRVYENGAAGISAATSFTISNCVAWANGSTGISAYGASVISNCSASQNIGSGLYGSSGSVFQGSSSLLNGLDGIKGLYGLVTNCSARFNGGEGIDVAGGLIRGNRSSSNDGAQIDDDGQSTIIENHAP